MGREDRVNKHSHLQSCGYVVVMCDNFGFVNTFIEARDYYTPISFLYSDLPWYYMVPIRQKKACMAVTERRHIEQHKEEECPYRQYRCAHCGYSDTYDAIAGTGQVSKKDSKIKSGTNHHDECLHFPLDCPNRCGEEKIERRNMKTHREKCPREPVECPFGGHACLGNVTRASVLEHQKDCDFRPYKCDYCGKKGTFASITGEESVKFYSLLETCHYDECLEYPLVCPNGCGDTFKRKEAKTHQGKCPMEYATCPFSHVGCTTKLLQRELDSHCQEEMHKHLLLMAKSHKELSEINKDLVCKNRELERLMGVLSEKLNTMERRITLNYRFLGGRARGRPLVYIPRLTCQMQIYSYMYLHVCYIYTIGCPMQLALIA